MRKILIVISFSMISLWMQSQTWEELRSNYQDNMKKADYQLAEEFAIKAKEKAVQEFGVNSKNYATSLNDLGLLYKYFGKFGDAEPLYKDALEIKKKIYSNKHPNYATAVNNLAGLYVDMDEFDKAEKMYEEAIEIYKTTLGEKHYNYVNSRFSLGKLYHKRGDYAKAEKLYRETIPLKKEILGAKHPDYVNSMSNLAVLLKSTGSYDESSKLLLELLVLKEEIFGLGHPYYIASLINLASLYVEIQEYEDAKPLYEKALTIQEQTIGKKHPDYAVTLNNLAALYNNTGQYDKAKQLFDQALLLRKEIFGDTNPKYAKTLDDLANLYFSKNEFIKAEELLIEAFQIRKASLARTHPEYAISNKNLALLYLEQGKYDMALPYFKELTEIRFRQIKNNFQFLSEVEKERYWGTFKEEFDIFNTFVVKYHASNPALVAEIYNNYLNTKGILFYNNLKVRESIINSNNEALVTKFNSWQDKRQKLSKINLLPAETIDLNGINLSQLETEINLLEKELSDASSVFDQELNKKDIVWSNIKEELEANEVAIEFLAFNFYQNKHFTEDKFYVAMLIKSTSEYPELIEIGTEEDLLDYFGATLSNSGISDYILSDSIATELYDFLWSPIERRLDSIDEIYLSFSGILNKLAMNMLPGKNGQRMLEDYQIHYLNSTKTILNAKQNYGEQTKSATIFGGILYDVEPKVLTKNAAKYKNGSLDELVVDVNENEQKDWVQTWDYLPGTKLEAVIVGDMLLKDNWKIDTVFSDLAVEESFKTFSGKSPRVIHLATHGFFFSDISSMKPISFFSQSVNFKKIGSNPMYRSGLIMAGANHTWSGLPKIHGIEDGILTAYEVSNMNLSNTELVVMSACETGLGDIKTGEGVYGLQRAFQLAGVESVIMSLWTVPDKETVELITEFYKHWIESGDKYLSFRKAQLKMSEKYSPYNWAGFILIE